MVSMKRETRKDGGVSVLGDDDSDYYPHSLYLDKEDLSRLGLSDCEIGEVKTLVIKTKVTAVSQGAQESGDEYQTATLTITEAHTPDGKSEAETVLY